MRETRPRIVLTRPDGLTVRVVSPTDPVLSQVSDVCYETLHRPFGVTRQIDWNEKDPSSTHLAVTDGDRIAGYARLLVSDEGGHVRQVVVSPAYRRRGVGTDVVRCAIELAAEHGVPLVYLNARPGAVNMYQRLGFTVVGDPFRMGRTYLPHVRMELPLRGRIG